MPGADGVTIKRLGEPGEGSYRVLVNGRLLGYVTRGVGGRWDGRDLVTGCARRDALLLAGGAR